MKWFTSARVDFYWLERQTRACSCSWPRVGPGPHLLLSTPEMYWFTRLNVSVSFQEVFRWIRRGVRLLFTPALKRRCAVAGSVFVCRVSGLFCCVRVRVTCWSFDTRSSPLSLVRLRVTLIVGWRTWELARGWSECTNGQRLLTSIFTD